MSHPGIHAAVEYEAETNFAEDVTTFGTLRIPIIEMPDLSTLRHEKHNSGRIQQHRQGGSQWIVGTQVGSTFKTKMWLTGHGSTTSGATSLTTMETLLGIIIGNATVSAASGTTLTGGTAVAPTTTASGTFAAGSLCRIGALNDTRGNAQFYPVSTHVTNTLTLLAAMDGAPTNGDVLFSAVNIYPNETPTSSSVTSIRMRVLTSNLRYELHGCVPIAIAFSPFTTGERPWIEVTWAVSWWRYSTATFPSTLATDSNNPAPITAGSVFLNTVGTSTRVKHVARTFTLDWTLGMELLKGPGGVNVNQEYVGARRTPDAISVSFTADADAATTTPVIPGLGTAANPLHLCFTGSTAAGTALGIYLRNLCVTAIATQKIDQNINRLTLDAMAYTGTTTTSELTLAAAVMAFA